MLIPTHIRAPLNRTALQVAAAVACLGVCVPAHANRAHARYLEGYSLDLVRVLAPPPAPGSEADELDRSTFRNERSQLGSKRWMEAQADVREDVQSMLRDFSPAAGTDLSVERNRYLARLLIDVRGDVEAIVGPAKTFFARRRPFLVDQGPICQSRKDLESSYDYPSGHTTWGTTVGLILAELLPKRATDILARAREYGESRVICGAHNASAVQAGRIAGASLLALLHSNRRFEHDLALTKIEMRKVDSSPNSMRRAVSGDGS